jgi:hypothetical protein
MKSKASEWVKKRRQWWKCRTEKWRWKNGIKYSISNSKRDAKLTQLYSHTHGNYCELQLPIFTLTRRFECEHESFCYNKMYPSLYFIQMQLVWWFVVAVNSCLHENCGNLFHLQCRCSLFHLLSLALSTFHEHILTYTFYKGTAWKGIL